MVHGAAWSVPPDYYFFCVSKTYVCLQLNQFVVYLPLNRVQQQIQSRCLAAESILVIFNGVFMPDQFRFVSKTQGLPWHECQQFYH
jgi:hypothetical protein